MASGGTAAPRVLSVFSGIGGMDLGFEAAGFEIVGCVEKDETARRSLALNRDSWSQIEPCDVTDLIDEEQERSPPEWLGEDEIDVLAGGPPCQPFSKAAQWSENGRGGMSDPRSECIRSFFHLARDLLPKVILVENVRGFIQGETSAAEWVEVFLDEVEGDNGAEYSISYGVLNAVEYGVPQKRERAFLVAVRDGEKFSWPEPRTPNKPVRSWDALADVEEPDPPSPRGKWADLVATVPEGENYIYHTPRGEGRPLFGYRTRFWSFLLKLAKDKPSWTLPAQPGPATGPFHWDGRPLGTQEMLRLQSFPADWQVAGTRREQVRQIGNATPPVLAEVLGRSLGRQVFDRSYDDPPALKIDRRDDVPAPVEPEPVPDKYLHLVDDHDPHPGAGQGPDPVKQT